MASKKIYECKICGGDLVPIPGVNLGRCDSCGTTQPVPQVTDDQKVRFLQSLLERLNEDGKILIGDVAFRTRTDLEQCQREVGEEWDDEEIYFVIDEMRQSFPNLIYQPVSHCAGILTLSR